jgi:hypothetical protein
MGRLRTPKDARVTAFERKGTGGKQGHSRNNNAITDVKYKLNLNRF